MSPGGAVVQRTITPDHIRTPLPTGTRVQIQPGLLPKPSSLSLAHFSSLCSCDKDKSPTFTKKKKENHDMDDFDLCDLQPLQRVLNLRLFTQHFSVFLKQVST